MQKFAYLKFSFHFLIMRQIGRGVSSKVYITEEDGETFAVKVFDPSRLAKTLYLLCFQSSYPYNTNKDALASAYHRRRVAHKITKTVLGDNNIVNAHKINPVDYALYHEYVSGRNPSDDEKSIDDFLDGCEKLLTDCGLPTWQVSRFNPSRRNNVLVDKNSNYKVIDFESGVPFPPWKFDDVDFTKLKGYVEKIKDKMSENKYEELLFDIKQCEYYTQKWKDSELAVPRKLQDGFRLMKEATTNPEYGKKIALDKIDACVQRLSKECELDEEKVNELYDFNPRILEHLGVHMSISIATPSGLLMPIFSPISSSLRFTWTVYHWNRARKNEDEKGKKLHNWKVAALSILPMVGAVSYLASNNFKASAVLLDQFYYEKIGRHLPILKDLPLFKQLVVNRLRK